MSIKKPVHMLHIEDNPNDAELIGRMLADAGIATDVVRVETQADFLAAIEHDGFDLIISDYTLPSFDGLSALHIARDKCPDVPFIFVSGTIGEASAIESLVNGAMDYVLKNNLSRLAPAVRRVLRDAENSRKRKQAELEVQKLSSAVEQTANCILITDKNGIIEYVNPSFVRTTGYTKEEAIGNTPRILKSGKHEERFYRELWETILSGRVFYSEFINRRKSGELFYQEETITPILDDKRNITHFVATGRDITERKQAEKQISMLAHAVRSISECVSITDMEDKVLFVNEAFLKTYGYDEQELLGKHIRIVRSPSNPPEVVREILPATVRGGWQGELLNRRKDGAEFPISLSTSVVRDASAQPVALIGVATDITDRKRAEERLKKSEEKYRSLVNNINDGFFITGLQGNITFANEALAKILGYKSKDDIIGRHFSTFIPPGLKDEMVKQRRRSLETGEAETLEVPFIKADGTNGFIELKPSPVFEDDKIIGDMGVIREVTERKKLEEQIRQVQKMESIGTLAGGIAHDFNNILGIILGYLSFIEHNPSNASILKSSADTITKAVERGASLVRQILTFARRADVALQPISVNDEISELSKMLKEIFPKTIDIALKLDNSIPIISMDQTQLHQALMNLCVNARDAMTDPSPTKLGRGKLTIQTEIVPGNTVQDVAAKRSASHHIRISVSDTGTGMDEATKQKIFEPFFTTKELGKGTGLGLAVAYGVVKSHQGHIDVESEPGHGTTFKLYFPIPKDIIAPIAAEKTRAPKIQGGTETILLVEDEESLLNLMKSILEVKGYRVLVAQDGMEAIQVFMRHKAETALVLTDMGLPKLDGTSVFSTLKKINPHIKVIVASGYLEPNSKSELFKSGANDFVQKPYDPQEVLRKVREVLDLK